MRRLSILATTFLALTGLAAGRFYHAAQPALSGEEMALASSLSLAALPPLAPDASNHVADDPAAADLGGALFFDIRFSANGKVSCATCHMPDRQFQDDLPLAHGVGTTGRRTMPIAGMAYAPFLFWDGRKDSLWAQALGPLESAVEHGGDRTQYARVIAENYAGGYEALFGPLPELGGLPDHAGPVADPAAAAAWDGMPDAKRDAVTRVLPTWARLLPPTNARSCRPRRALTPGSSPRSSRNQGSSPTTKSLACASSSARANA
jgi:cytochrome c peroxidase